MAVLITELAGGRDIPMNGGLRGRLVQVTGDTAYPAGGYPVTAAQVGLTTIAAALCAVSGGRVMQYDSSTAKIIVLECGGANTPMADNNDANIATTTAPMFFIGA